MRISTKRLLRRERWRWGLIGWSMRCMHTHANSWTGFDLPEEFRNLTTGIVFRVDDFPDAGTKREMGLQSPFDLMGLYSGVPIGEKDSGMQTGPNMIFLYRRPLLDYWCETEENLTDLVRHVLIHEIGHHFGLSDEDMERI